MKQITFHLAWYLAIECSGDSEGYTGDPEKGRNRSKGIWDTHTEQRFSSNMNQDQVGESSHLKGGHNMFLFMCFFKDLGRFIPELSLPNYGNDNFFPSIELATGQVLCILVLQLLHLFHS